MPGSCAAFGICRLTEELLPRTGKTLAYTRVEILSADTGKLLAYGKRPCTLPLADSPPDSIRPSLCQIRSCMRSVQPQLTHTASRAGSHTKYIADALTSDKNVKFSEDGESITEGVEPEP